MAKKKKSDVSPKEDFEKVEEEKKIEIQEEKKEIIQVESTEVVPEEEIIEIKEIQETIKKKKKVPKEEMEKINSKLFKNIMMALCVIIYFIFLNLGEINIKSDVYITDLKVFSLCILLVAITVIEVAYKKDSGEIALYGIEMLVLSIVTVAFIYVELMLSTKYRYIVTVTSYIFAIYYLTKSIVIYIKRRKKYFVDDMKEIINKEE